ncbi:ATP-binding protein [Brevibacillus choshinensis]|uniref:ATP-binding protein n=1 Tax=Brevibacillus choshinensis TaxID=54911 RepID=UPI002E23433B|nr:ATP-binding protein [Brevibacillus choshinensis]MED4783823.1 ATP-binding protein [Brevibacillus choshinensis]
MSELRQVLKKSITRRFTAMMLMFLSLLIAGAAIVLYTNYTAFSQYQTTLKASKEKQVLVEQIADHTNQIFFRARGYYAFLSPYEYNELFVEKEKLKQAISSFKRLPLTSEEQVVVASIESFISNFFANVFPTASGYAKAGQYESLRNFSSSGVNQEVNNLITYASTYKKKNEQLLLQENRTLFEDVTRQSLWFILYILVVLILSLWVTKRTTRDIGAPLERLSVEANRFSHGELPHFQDLHRVDEIGNLARSLDFLIRQIQIKEETLMAQNEELQAQQDELMMQQEELQEALAKMEDNERYLQKRNRLIQSLANTLDKQELLQSIVRNIVEVMDADKGIIVLLNADKDISSFGVSPLGVNQFLNGLKDGPLVRIRETRQPYVLTRESTEAERGYQEAASQTYELYLPVLQADQAVVACIVLSRIGRTLSELEKQMAIGLAKQISLSLDKLAMHEETEKQRQMTQDMLDTIQEGVQLIGINGVTLQVNRTFQELLSFPDRASAQGIGLADYFKHMEGLTKDHEQLVSCVNATLSGHSENKTHLIELTYPQVRYIQLYAEPLYRDQEKWGTLLVYRDITKEYEIDQMKSEFVSTVSHELRTPLASVLGFAELLLNKELKPERQHRYTTAIYQEARRLTALINDFLDLQRMESGRQTYERELVPLEQVVREIFGLYRVQSPLHSFELDLQTEKTVIEGDRDKLRQVIMNLVSNAVKYSPAGGCVRVVCRNEGNQLLVEVHDEGLGIPPEAIPHLFTKFYRVDNSDRREIGGTGLGLAIVQEIVHIHNGEIAVASESGHGSTFTVALPLPEQQPAAFNEPDSPETYPHSLHSNGNVVIIEDDVNLSELLRDELIGSGFTVYAFSHAAQALTAIEEITPDAVVLDLVLQDGEDGWKVIETMRENPKLRSIPIVISSAFEEKKKAFDLGAKGYLIKPYHPDTLSKAILLAVTSNDADGQIFIPDQIKD